jgi:glutamine amidotransferase
LVCPAPQSEADWLPTFTDSSSNGHTRFTTWRRDILKKMGPQSPKTLIVDYGMGNIRSLSAAVEYLRGDVVVSDEPREIATAEIVLLPGVGSFPAAMAVMDNRGLSQALRDAAQTGKSKLLGICLGMQLLMESSNEGEGATGLGILGGSVERFPTENDLPVPHIGFNSVRSQGESVLFAGLGVETDFYFVHSYRALNAGPEALVATCHYGGNFVAAIESGNVYGTQFHPEKSQNNGLRLLANFLAAEIR